MEWNIPGTALTGRRDRPDIVEDQIRSMFLGGGIARSQVSAVTGLEPYTVQNWVKRGFLAPPVAKRYSCRQLCRIIIINMLKSTMPLEQICELLSYINGHLDDESDDCIDDAELYFAFLHVAARIEGPKMELADLRQVIHGALEQYREPQPGARERVENVVLIMLIAWEASALQQTAQSLFTALNNAQKGELQNGKQ